MKSQIETVEQAIEARLVEARKESLKRLGDIEHRLEFVELYEEVEFINDAKAADLNSTWYSIDCMDKPIVWIVSSTTYEEDYSLFDELDTSKIRAVIIMGTNKDPIQEKLEGRVELVGQVNTMIEAVSHATLIADSGDVVLYSPAFSDFEPSTHFKERGQQFRKAVREMRL
ncbi:MAG: hypothetical protein HN542_03930 [Flavobacteriales bacterium]|jgi:UDP-N-acetylmuramoylalanine--D-glutamate ligase|nr:hypothetical protein [Flavobacteriales bacterium]MBT3963024.1 hypothetical protein [Flavobacteriales bacterium]MBT4705159.1 hypothetical protein [Flavobacteriales bacterium]MBT4930179.1 hypothetical protein [Flavobacteriales bacterium]MBT5133137.1 hypothetical protein [Flavobacteriales bacterium]